MYNIHVCTHRNGFLRIDEGPGLQGVECSVIYRDSGVGQGLMANIGSRKGLRHLDLWRM